MKYCTGYRGTRSRCVAPLVGAWIEIDAVDTLKMLLKVAPLVGAWIEIKR